MVLPSSDREIPGSTEGLAPLLKFIHSFVENVYRPAYADWEIFADIGAGDALPKVCLDHFASIHDPQDASLTMLRAFVGSRRNLQPRRQLPRRRMVLQCLTSSHALHGRDTYPCSNGRWRLGSR